MEIKLNRWQPLWRWVCTVLLVAAGIGDSMAAPGAWETGAGFRSRAIENPGTERPGFRLLSSATTGVTFTNRLGLDRQTTNQIFLNGSGVALGDVDGDGLCDFFLAALEGESALYRNLGGWRFQNIAREAGVTCADGAATGAVLADLDGDGDLDLVVNTIGSGTRVLVNDGKGRFAPGAMLNPGRCGTSLAVADIDGDGALDLYVCNYRTRTLRDQPGTQFRVNRTNGEMVVVSVNGVPTTSPELAGRFTIVPPGRIAEHGEPDVLYRNEGGGRFVAIPFTEGRFLDEDGKPLSAPPYDWGLSVTFRDLNGDGAPDLYVCNDFDSPDRVWMNDGRGRFRAIPRIALRNTSKFSMGVDVADVNRDGFDDILVLDMQSRSHVTRLTRADRMAEFSPIGSIEDRPQLPRNTLHLNRGDGTYAEVAHFAGLESSEWSWTPVFLDVDLDGFEDLLITTGHARDDMDVDTGTRIESLRRSRRMPVAEELGLRKQTPSIASPRLAFRNRGDVTFEEVGAQWGFDQVGVAHGMAMGDLDGDGDMDVVVNTLNGEAGVYRNVGSGGRVGVRLRGEGGNVGGIGARVRLVGGVIGEQSQEMMSGGRYMSGDEAMRVFGTGGKEGGMRIEVEWRSGKRSVVEGVKANRVYEVEESGGEMTERNGNGNRAEGGEAWFVDVSKALGHVHAEEGFDDYGRQGLLWNRLSQLGPGVGLVDVTGDGREDVVVGSGKGGELGVYENVGGGKFEKRSWGGGVEKRDQSGVAWGGGGELMVGSANYEDGDVKAGSVKGYGKRGVREMVGGQEWSAGPVALVDMDGDGSLELFVGGRVNGGRYPEAAGFVVMREKEGKWEEVVREAAVGLVSGAVWTDLNGDGYAELVLASEWGPLRVYGNEKGKLREMTKEWGLEGEVGWWNGVTAGDVDGDGRMDVVATNWGRNSKYRVGEGRKRRVYYGDLAGSGGVEVMEAYEEGGKWVPERDLGVVGRVMPWVKEKYELNRKYAEAGVEEILGGRETKVLEVGVLESKVYLNRGGRLEGRALPREAQLSPGYGVSVGDFDGDGKEDVVMSQNFHGVTQQTSRNDGGRGLVMQGDGKGGFEAVVRSGVKVYGEGRGVAVGDYDGDGRLDVVMGQNGGETKLYRNVNGKAGVRVRLKGEGGNPEGLGAMVRVERGGKWGASREVRGGGGYWSQDSTVLVMGVQGEVSRVKVRWAGGKETEGAVAPGAREIEVEQRSGNVRVIR